MRLHTDTLYKRDLYAALPREVMLHATLHGSRSRDHAYEVQLRGYGTRHTRAPNTGVAGALSDAKAATYSDWGYWLAALFAKDPKAIAGHYKSEADFHLQTGGLYRNAGDLPQLAAEVRALIADGHKRRHAVALVAENHELNEWLLERALFGIL